MATNQQLSIPVGIQTIYFNGIGVGMGNIDLSIILNHNQIPTTELKLTYPVAKTLAAALSDAVSKYEKHTGQIVIGAKELGDKFNASVSGQTNS